MATRQTTHILKNSNIVNRPLPSSLLPIAYPLKGNNKNLPLVNESL